jgi:hypothetical protein
MRGLKKLLRRPGADEEGRDAVTSNLEEAMRNVRLPGARVEDHPAPDDPAD